MATKLNVPLFNQSVDPSDITGTGRSFVSMAGGAFLAIAAFGVGAWLFNQTKDRAGVDDGFDIPVAGD